MSQGVKISALPAATTLTGAEILAMVQAGSTQRTTLDNVSAYVMAQHRSDSLAHPQYEVTANLSVAYHNAKSQ